MVVAVVSVERAVAQTAVEAAGRISYGRQGPRPEAEELLEVLADHRGIKR